MLKDFVHLHNHSHYSLLDASSKIDKMVKRTKELGMKAIALTDHGTMSGAVQLWRECNKEGIKPLIGCELYVSVDNHLVKKRQRGVRNYHHLVVIAMNQIGYKNLCAIVSEGYINGFYYKPRVSLEFLNKHNEGLFVSSACMVSHVAQELLNSESDEEAIKRGSKVVDDFVNIFTTDRFRLELQDHGIPEQKLINERMIKLSQATGVPLVFTNDCHFVLETDFHPHKCFKCIQGGKNVNEIDHVYKPDHRIKSIEEMSAIADSYDESVRPILYDAMGETVAVADQVDFSFTTGKYFFPAVETETGNVSTEFRKQCIAGFQNRFAGGEVQVDEDKNIEYLRRLFYEMFLIEKMGFEDYFLIVSDIIRYAKANDIPVGPGRGSAAGSLVSYCLDITDLDPIEHGLLFERFLNPARISMPDIDIDFSKRDRHKLIDYTVEKYGRENVAQIITFGTLKARAILRDMAKVHGMSAKEGVEMSSLVPQTPGDPFDLDRALAEVPEVLEALQDPQKKQVWDVAKELEGVLRHASLHAAGIVITPEPVSNYAPLFKPTKSDEIAAAYDMNDLEELGLVKMDYLGLKTLDLIQDVTRLANISEDLTKLDLKDRDVYRYIFAAGNTKGVFQFESPGMRQELQRLIPENFDDIVAMNALYRPGPMDSGMMESFIRRKNGQEEATSIHPAVSEHLESTHGVMVFQEQVMNVVRELGDFSLGEADVMRKAMGKKIKSLMDKEIDKFVQGGLSKGYSEEELRDVADKITTFARYGFNRAHAAAYSFIAYQTAWLKHYYPVEFMCALLNNETEDNKPEKVREYIADAKKMGMKILPPDINYSDQLFVIENLKKRHIRYGLASLKNVGSDICAVIVKEREENGLFRSLPDFIDRVKLNKKVMEALIYAGATLSLGGHQAEHYENYLKIAKDKRKQKVDDNQVSLLKLMDEHEKVIEQDMISVEPWTDRECSDREKEALGMWLEHHPLNSFLKEITDDLATLREHPKKDFALVCVVDKVDRRFHAGKEERFVLLTVEDLTGTATMLLWGTEKLEALNHTLKEGNVVKVYGSARMRDTDVGFSVKQIEVLEEVKDEEADTP